MGIKHRKLKDHVPRSAKEWLEYQDHPDRWTPEMQRILDQHMRDSAPVTPEDHRAGKAIREHLITSHRKKPS